MKQWFAVEKKLVSYQKLWKTIQHTLAINFKETEM